MHDFPWKPGGRKKQCNCKSCSAFHGKPFFRSQNVHVLFYRSSSSLEFKRSGPNEKLVEVQWFFISLTAVSISMSLEKWLPFQLSFFLFLSIYCESCQLILDPYQKKSVKVIFFRSQDDIECLGGVVSVKVIVQKIHSNLPRKNIPLRQMNQSEAAAASPWVTKNSLQMYKTIVSHISCKIMYAGCLSWCVFLAVQVVHSIKGAKRGDSSHTSQWVSLLKQTIFRMALSLQSICIWIRRQP